MKMVKSLAMFALTFTALCWTGCSRAEQASASQTSQKPAPMAQQAQQALQDTAMQKQQPSAAMPQSQSAPQDNMAQKKSKSPDAKSEQQAQAAGMYKDGAYSAQSDMKDDWGGYGEARITITGGKITGCEFLSYEKDGKLKGEDYGKTNGVIKNAGLYKIAQAAIQNAAKYGTLLVETQQLDKVDAIAGATVSYELFQNAAALALQQAEKAAR